jgi:transposase InsO family protein
MLKMSLNTRRELALQTAKRYRMASRKEKSAILKGFCEDTGYKPKYAIVLLKKAFLEPEKLRNQTSGKAKKRKRRRNRKYGEVEKAVLLHAWRISGYLCSKLLKAYMAENIDQLRRFNEVRIDDETAQKLLEISPATIERLLSDEKPRRRRKRSASTNPALLRNLVPLAVNYERPPEPGHLHVDLVVHCGASLYGDYVCTITATDRFTGLTNVWACLGKSQRAVFEALSKTFSGFPFPIKTFQTDNGSEFLNGHLVRWAEEAGMVYLRSHEYRKQENAYVEERNGHIVRKFVGHRRFDTTEERDLLNQAYEALNLLQNLFLPRMMTNSKERTGSRITRHRDNPMTPMRRALPFLSPEKAQELLELRESLNPAELMRVVETIINRLYSLRAEKEKEAREALSCAR